jgi:hypothetical protein
LTLQQEEREVAWIATPYRAPVLDTDGEALGTAESLLGDEDDDIFHGLAVKLARDGRVVEIPAARIPKITNARVFTDVTPDEVDSLPAWEHSRWFHLEWGGLFRRHPDWKETGGS